MTDEAKAPMGGEVEEAVKRLTWMLGNAEGAANYDVLPDPDRDEASKDAAVFRATLAALAQPKEGEIPANLFDRPEDVDEAMRERRQAYPLPTAHMPSREEVRTALALAFTNMKADDLRWKATSHEGFDRAMDHLTDALFKGEA